MVPSNDRDLLGGQGHHSIGPGAAAVHAMGQIDTAIPPPPQQQQQPPQQPSSSSMIGDLLGFNQPAQQPQQQQQQPQPQVINANHATVSITTSSSGAAVAPSIAGLGKIEPSSAADDPAKNHARSKPKRKTIYVPTYSCSGGFDTKFNHHARHARPSDLHGLLTAEEYEREVRTLNDKMKKARPKAVDGALLATGALMVPLAVWGARHGRQVKQKRKLIEEGTEEFNERMGMAGRNVRMVWNRAKVVGGGESYLTIEEGDPADARKKVD